MVSVWRMGARAMRARKMSSVSVEVTALMSSNGIERKTGRVRGC
jgi:hypothetical protein